VRRAKVVAIGGIDGSGKTSTIDTLRSNLPMSSTNFVRTSTKENARRVWSLSGADIDSPRAHFSGDVAESIRFAHAFDFLEHYEARILPLLATESLVVSDRWSYCTVAFANAGTRLGSMVSKVLMYVDPPDCFIYLDISAETAVQRIASRGEIKGDESVALLAEYRLAYEELLPSLSCPVVKITNRDHAETVARVLEICRSVTG
jgi:thymidylate kinase